MGQTNTSTKTPGHADGDGAPQVSDAQAADESRKAAWKTLGGAELAEPAPTK